MNNLKKLRKEMALTTRDIQKYTKISYSTVFQLETEGRSFREVHIEKLSAFFNVTTDFLLGKSDLGYKVRVERGGEELLLTEEEYNRLATSIECTIITLPTEPQLFDVSTDKVTKKLFVPKQVVYRELKGSITSHDLRESLFGNYVEVGKTLTSNELKRAIKFIEEFIKKN